MSLNLLPVEDPDAAFRSVKRRTSADQIGDIRL
jgi:hypothetical protein